MRVRCRARAHVREIEGLVKAEHVASQDHIIRKYIQKEREAHPKLFLHAAGRPIAVGSPSALLTHRRTHSIFPSNCHELSKVIVVGERLEGKIECVRRCTTKPLGERSEVTLPFGPHIETANGVRCALFLKVFLIT